LTIYKYIYFHHISEELYRLEFAKKKKQNLILIRKRYYKKRNEINTKRKKEIWIINDRSNQAGDNDEYFFRYLKQKNLDNIDMFLAFEKNCNDYKRLKLIDNKQ